jgi:hypothetical protein
MAEKYGFGSDNKKAREKAFLTLIKDLNFDARFPQNVFLGKWDRFLFCESDRIFCPEFIDAVNEFLDIENAAVACLLNLDITDSMEFESAGAMYLDRSITQSEYDRRLRGNGPSDGWIYRMDRYACTSDVGEWCIYCERNTDVAVIALRSAEGLEKFRSPLLKMWAYPLETICDSKDKKVFPFTHLVPAWREGLAKNYNQKFQNTRKMNG